MLPITLAPDVRRQVLHYLGATFNFREKAVEQALQRFLNDPEDGIFKGPWLQLRRPFRPAEAMEKVRAGTAVLIDVREPGEWSGGVVEGAILLPLSDLQGERVKWGKPLAEARGRELVLYCRSGNRSGIAAGILEKEGWVVWNAGGFSALVSAGQKVTKP